MSDLLDDFLAIEDGTVVVNLWDECSQALRAMEEVMTRLEAQLRRQVKVLRLSLHEEENRAWASRYQIRGAPAILVFRNGRLIATLRGAVTFDDLLSLLNAPEGDDEV